MGSVGDKIKKQEDEKRAYSKMLSFGWTPEQASGIVGNLVWESRLDTSILGTADDKGSRGIAQWHSGRLKTLQKKYGDKWTDLDNQLEFVNWELNNTHKKAGDKLRNSSGVYNTGQIVSDDYEIPKDKWNANKKRQAVVYDIHKKYSGQKFTEEDVYQSRGSEGYSGEIYRPYTPPSMTPENGNIDIATAEPTKDTPEEAQAKEKIDKVTAEQQMIQEFFAQNTAAQPQQQQEVQQEVQEFPTIGEQYAQVSQIVDNPIAQQGGNIPVSSQGVYDYPMQEVIVPTSNGSITMDNVDYPILGIDEFGNRKMMHPGQEYKFPGKIIHEIPKLKNYFNKR